MKSIRLWLQLSVLVMVLLPPASVKAQYACSTNIDGSLTITQYTGPGGDVIIPSTINGNPVTGVGPFAFRLPGDYTAGYGANRIAVPNSVTNLASSAFAQVYTYSSQLSEIYFQGNAPVCTNIFDSFSTTFPIVHYLAGTTGWGTNFNNRFAQVWYPGELNMTLLPTNAVINGAEWQVDGGTWQTNGAIVENLSEGNHVISYKSIPGWRTPADQIMFVDTNFINSTNGSYDLPLPGVQQQTLFQVIHAFTGTEGSNPMGGLIIYSNRLYGTTSAGGISGNGTLFAINTDGTGFTNLYQFPGGAGGYDSHAGLAQSGNVFYGTTLTTVFMVNADGSGFTNLCNVDDAYSGVVLSSNRLYGTTINGGTNGRDMLYAVNTDGSGFEDVHDFDGSAFLAYSGVALSGDTLYGATLEGPHGGCIYKLKTDGTGYTVIYQKPFESALLQSKMMISGNLLYWGSTFSINTDGTDLAYLGDGQDYGPNSVLSGNTFYAVDGFAGPQSNAHGTIYAVRTDGSGYTNLYTFTGGSGGGISRTQPSCYRALCCTEQRGRVASVPTAPRIIMARYSSLPSLCHNSRLRFPAPISL